MNKRTAATRTYTLGLLLYASCFLLPIWTYYSGNITAHYGPLRIIVFLGLCLLTPLMLLKKNRSLLAATCLLLALGAVKELDGIYSTIYGLCRFLGLVIALTIAIKCLAHKFTTPNRGDIE